MRRRLKPLPWWGLALFLLPMAVDGTSHSITKEVRFIVKDPVCGMDVDPKTAAGKSEYKGQTYYFCSNGCKRAFSVAPGEIVLIMSLSGSGKTTLLSMLGALLRPSAGEIRLNGDVISAMKESRLPDIRWLAQNGKLSQAPQAGGSSGVR